MPPVQALIAEDWARERMREVGTLISEARQRERRSVRECAALLGTSRRRYSAIERGEVVPTLIEMDVLMRTLGIPAASVWGEFSAKEVDNNTVVVETREGKLIRLVVTIRDEL